MAYPPEYGPLAAVTPGTPGGLMTMLAEFGTMSLKEVLAPAIQMADGYPIEQQAADTIERQKGEIKKWPPSVAVFLTHPGERARRRSRARSSSRPTSRRRSASWSRPSKRRSRRARAARRPSTPPTTGSTRGTSRASSCAARANSAASSPRQDLANWKVHIEEPVVTRYKGIDVYKLNTWVQGPVMLQALNMLEPMDLKAMGYNSARYIHTLYQVMNLTYADRDFYYGDPYMPPATPLKGLLSKEYARERAKLINWDKNDPNVKPGDPYPFQGETNPYTKFLANWPPPPPKPTGAEGSRSFEEGFTAGTTSIEAADEEGWVVSVTPSGGWIPATIAGRTGIGMSQRMQAFVLDEAMCPFNVVTPGKRPRSTLTPSLALKDGKPYLAFAVQGGDTQDQNLLQFFLNMVEFGMNVQQATEAANFNSYQMHSTFGDHRAEPGRMTLNEEVPPWVREDLDPARLQAGLPEADLGADQRDLLRPPPRDDVGRVEQPRGGLRHRLVGLRARGSGPRPGGSGLKTQGSGRLKNCGTRGRQGGDECSFW